MCARFAPTTALRTASRSRRVPIVAASNGVRKLFTIVILFAGMALGACGQMPPTTPPGIHEIEGRIVDVRGGRMMLHDGSVFLIPGNVAKWSELSLGAIVRVQYEERDGQKVATAMTFRQGAEGQRGM